MMPRPVAAQLRRRPLGFRPLAGNGGLSTEVKGFEREWYNGFPSPRGEWGGYQLEALGYEVEFRYPWFPSPRGEWGGLSTFLRGARACRRQHNVSVPSRGMGGYQPGELRRAEKELKLFPSPRGEWGVINCQS